MYLHRLIQTLPHIYDRNFCENSGEILNCSLDNDHEYSEHTITVFSSSKKMVGHISDPLAIKFFFH